MSLSQDDSNPVKESMPPVPTPLIPLPPWAERSLRRIACLKCKRPPGRRDVTAIGLRRQDGQPHPVFFCELRCAQCDEAFLLYLPKRRLDVIGLAEAILDGEEHVRPEDREIDAAARRAWQAAETAKRLGRIDSHEEFMRLIGISRRDMRRFGTYRGRRRKQPDQPLDRPEEAGGEKDSGAK